MHLVHISPTRPTKLYNLDFVISVGYRVEARNGTLFRKWATDKLVQYLTKGDPKSATQGNEFFAEIQNTMHWAVLGMTAPELIRDRVDASKPYAGVVTFKGKMPTVKNAQTAKDLLEEPEIKALNHITSLVLEFFESQVEQRRLTTLGEFVAKMRELVKLDGRPVKPPGHAGKVTRTAADKWASDQIRAYKARIKLEAEDSGEKKLKKIAASLKARR